MEMSWSETAGAAISPQFSHLHTASPIAINILRRTRCQYWVLRPIRRQAREKVVVPAASRTVRDSLAYSRSDRTASRTAEKMKTRMKAGPARN